MSRRAIIIGAGPAGLTAAYELLERTDIIPVVIEQDGQVGGLAKTIFYKGNGLDIGGHRFFSKSGRVMAWWERMLPLERSAGRAGPDPEQEDRVMLVRTRRSRVYFDGKLFDYPITLSARTLAGLGPGRALRIGASYLRRVMFPIHPVLNLEHFLVNRFGDELYRTFFKAYTEKVWGTSCREISAAWGAQRIKDVSVAKAIGHWLRGLWRQRGELAQQDVSTSMIERYCYPKLGPGQMWEQTAQHVRQRGGEILLHHRAVGIHIEGNRATGITVRNEETGAETAREGDIVFSSMPVQELVRALGDAAPAEVREAAEGLRYRDFITVGLQARRVTLEGGRPPNGLTRDGWFYIQEPSVRLGRLQFYNNWSAYLIRDPGQAWLGLEYFCNEGDGLWRQTDEAVMELGIRELAQLGFIDPEDVCDGIVVRVKKAYPAYVGAYERFPVIRAYMDRIENLFLVGRNGMHKYNNQDHAMLTAMTAVDNIVAGKTSKENIWAVNTEEAYLEEMKD